MHFHGVNLEKNIQFPQKNANNLFVFAGFCGGGFEKPHQEKSNPLYLAVMDFVAASAYLRFSKLKDLLLLLCI